ncbi:MAG: molybdopterin-binding protein [Leptospiraceae bacterium]|nr:molybdopterin-binding protein [Leptospiraceae bacterium]
MHFNFDFESSYFRSNLYVLLAFLQKLNIEPVQIAHLKDEESTIHKKIGNAIEVSDCILCTGGVSAGDADFLPSVFEKLGIQKKFHKVEIRPGKPLWFGVASNGCKVFGLPGNPLAVQVTYKIFVEPFLKNFLGMSHNDPFYFPIEHDKFKKHSLTHFFPVRLVNIERETFIREVPHNGSGDIKAALFSDGLAIQEKEKFQLTKRELIPFYIW